ncbi:MULTISPECIES: SCO family protein [Frankia]|uniref:SCO family protein n=1 Tax=Frankia TaxID=1854 RepID=UPI0021174626|nr:MULTISPECIES: SCO family protein [Frankia]
MKVLHRVIGLFLAFLAAALLAGCGGRSDGPVRVSATDSGGFAGTRLDPSIPRPAFTLSDTAGRTFDFRTRTAGKVAVLFFGYTRCPDVCPTTMADLAAARALLPVEVRRRVDVVFVTEDPASDTAPVLRRWLDQFDPTFVGLRGGTTATGAVLDQLKLPRTVIKEGVGGESVEHSGVVYLFSPKDTTTVIHTGGTTAQQYAADLTRLAHDSSSLTG